MSDVKFEIRNAKCHVFATGEASAVVAALVFGLAYVEEAVESPLEAEEDRYMWTLEQLAGGTDD